MGGEMIFIHKDKPIENLEAYKKLLKDMEIDCKTTPIPVITNPITSWRERERYLEPVGTDEDYELSIDLGQSTRNPDNHYYIFFPKDPNAFKVLSDTHARGVPSIRNYEYDIKKWLHDWLIKFLTTFPGVFELYYGDGYCGFNCDVGEIKYCNGSAIPIRRDYSKPGDFI